MKSLEERFEDLKEDPVRLRRVLYAAIAIAYSMLMIGVVLIVYILYTERF